MKKRILVISLLVLVLGIAITAILISNQENKNLEITTIINAKNNYKCEVNIQDEDIVKYVKNYSLNDKENLKSEKTHLNFVFKGLKKGRTQVTIKCTSTIDNITLTEETFKVMVNQKLETSIYILEK